MKQCVVEVPECAPPLTGKDNGLRWCWKPSRVPHLGCVADCRRLCQSAENVGWWRQQEGVGRGCTRIVFEDSIDAWASFGLFWDG